MTFYRKTCKEIAEELGIKPKVVNIVINEFFRTIKRMLAQDRIISIKRYFKIKYNRKYFNWLMVNRPQIFPERYSAKNKFLRVTKLN